MAWMLYDINHPRFRGLVVRRNAKDLNDWIDRARIMYQSVNAQFVGNEIRFPTGAKIVLGHLNDENAFEQYQGHEYQRMLIEELTQIPRESDYLKLIASCRSTIKELRPQVFATTNPGGIGHNWVKNRFHLNKDTNNLITIKDSVSGQFRAFIPARIDDNPYLLENDPKYVQFLESLPDGLKEAWRYGSWRDIEIKGVYYSRMLSQAEKENRIMDLTYDEGLLCHTVWDLGIGKQLAIGFYQKLGREIAMIDYWEGRENDGIPQAKKVLQDKSYIYGQHFAPHDIGTTDIGTGKTRKETASSFGIDFIQVPKVGVNDGIEAGQIIFSRMFIDKSRCIKWLDAMRQYRQEWNEEKMIYNNKPVHDWTSHAADVHRYMAIVEEQMTNNKYDETNRIIKTKQNRRLDDIT